MQRAHSRLTCLIALTLNTALCMIHVCTFYLFFPQHSSNSNYAYSSPASQTVSPPNSTGKTSSLHAPTNTINATDMHVSQGTPIMTSMPPNMTSLPPPVPYPVHHPPQYYNGTVLPQFTSDMYYNMVPGTCYPMMTLNGQDTYVPYYEVGEPCNANIPSEVRSE